MDQKVLEGFRLSPQQEQVWLRQAGEGGPFHAACAVSLPAGVDSGLLERAVRQVMARHEILRTTFQNLPGMEVPLQVIGEGAAVKVETWESSGDASGRDGAIEAGLSRLVRPPFDLEKGPLLRSALLTSPGGACVLLLGLPALCADAPTLDRLVRELGRSWRARGEPPAGEPSQYADISEWQNEVLESQDVLARKYWQSRDFVAGLAARLPFGQAGSGRAFEPAHLPLVLPPNLAAGIESLAASQASPPWIVLLSAWLTLLRRLTDWGDVAVGVAYDGRKFAELEEALGPLTRHLPLQLGPGGDVPFGEVVHEVAKRAAELSKWQEFFSWRTVTGAGTERPFFPYAFEFQEPSAEGPFLIERLRVVSEPFEVKLSCLRRPGGLEAELQYDAGVVRKEDVERLGGAFLALLRSAVSRPWVPVAELEVLDGPERRRVLREWNDTRADYPGPGCLHELVAAQAERTPERIAVEFEGASLSYAELMGRVSGLARELQRLGLGPDRTAAVCAGRSLEMVIGLLAVLQAGGSYIPLDPELPRERLAAILRSGAPVVVLAQERLLGALPEHATPVVVLETTPEGTTPGTRSGATPSNLAYALFTSGSTGEPKGVMISHAAIRNRLLWMQTELPLEADDRVLQKTPFSFDASIWEIFVPLLAGARLVMARPDGHREARYLLEAVAERGVTVLQLVPSMFRVLLEEPGVERAWGGLRRLYCGGEALPSDLQDRFFGLLPGVRLHNLYGPTEAAIDVAYRPCVPAEGFPGILLGRPIGNVDLYVADERGLPLPPGFAGELRLGGAGLARGYLGRPDLTAERFVPHPFSDAPGARLYRSGDLARFTGDGTLEFLGRIDAQVKIRGFRIEPGEVEAVLATHPEVLEAVVVTREDMAGDKRLVAYVVLRGTETGSTEELRGFLAERLPEYMVPAAFVALPALPRLPNGKLDRRALPAPVWEQGSAAAFAPPRGPVQELLAGLWRELLQVERVGARDDFFALGGHSLLATQMVTRLRQVFGVELSLRSLFQAPTLEGVAAAVEEARQAGGQLQSPPIEPAPRDLPPPVSFAQQRLWFLHQLDPKSPAYNLPTAIRFHGRFDLPVFQRALTEIARRHETLRTTFEEVDGEPVQRIAPPGPIELPVVDLAAAPVGLREAEARRLVGEEGARPFDLQSGPLTRAALLRLGPEEHAGLFNQHHIVSDAWSRGVLVGELTTLYRACSEGRPSPLPELPVQYADFAVWQRRWLRGEALEAQLGYWRGQLAGAPHALELPADRPRPPVQSFRGDVLPFVLDREVGRGLTALGWAVGATPFMTLAALFQALLRRYSGQDDVVVGTPIANRNRAEIEPMIGFFVNTLVLRAGFGDAPGFRALLARTRDVALDAFAHQDVPFEKLVEELQPERDLSRSPIFQVLFTLQNAPASYLDLPGLRLELWPGEGAVAKFDLELTVVEAAEGLGTFFVYSCDLFDASTVARMARHFAALAAGVLAEPDRPLDALPLLSDVERHQALVEWGGRARAPLGAEELAPRLFERQAGLTPGACAVELEGERLTYDELNRRADRLAGRLRSLGVAPEEPVALFLDRSLHLPAGLLGIWKSGGAFLPVDPAWPAERALFLLRDSGVRVVVSERRLAEALAAQAPGDLRWLLLDEEADGGPPDGPPPDLRPDSLAYVIYTSGSTGEPKGVQVEHGSLAAMLAASRETFGWRADDVMPVVSSPAFDIFLFELLNPLLAGGTAVLVSARPLLDPERVAAELERATRIHAVPALMRELSGAVRRRSGAGAPRLRTVFTGGDVVPLDLLAGLRETFPQAELRVLYGPTEGTVICSSGLVPPGERPTRSVLGQPLPGAVLHLRDAAGGAVPVGVVGEIWIGGPGVSRGYLRREELTAERYPAVDGERFYRTGDLARRQPDGALEFVGRADQQVKVRGFRIELGEVEAALARLPGVRAAVAAVRDDLGERRLVAYLVPEPGSGSAGLDAANLRARLLGSLPEYMVPTAFVTLEALPLTPHGKVDRRSLPAPRPDAGREWVAPRTPVEEVLAGLWREVLGVERVGAEDDFFALGGHSLLATRLVSRIRKIFKVDLPLSDFFGATTVAGLARVLVAHEPRPGQMEKIALLARKVQAMSDDNLREALARKRSTEKTNG